MVLGVLKDLGLSDNEARAYLSLLRLGPSAAGKISKDSEVNRSNLYDALERLVEKGLVSYVSSGQKKVFSAADPKRFGDLLNDKNRKLAGVMDQLKSSFEASRPDEDAFVFRGRKGIKAAYEDILSDKEAISVYGAESRFTDMFPIYQKQWNERRAKDKTSLKILFNERVRKRKRDENLKFTQMKFLPKEYDFPSVTLVYGDKTVIVIWAQQPFALLIKSKEAAKSNLAFFNLLWKNAKK